MIVMLTRKSGRPIAVNLNQILHAEVGKASDGGLFTYLTFVNGSVLAIQETPDSISTMYPK